MMTTTAAEPLNSPPSLPELGWRPFFQQQLSLEELDSMGIARIIEQHRNAVVSTGEDGNKTLITPPDSEQVCVGDWILYDQEHRVRRILERQSLFQRKAPGKKVETQLIAANIDTVFIVCSLNDDFNLNRIERYLSLAKEAKVEPVIILTKMDLCSDADDQKQQVQALDPLLMIHDLNTLDNEQLKQLSSYCQQGKTVALLGSSGVGKSTLVNGLMGSEVMQTGSIREDDSKGRHTTTSRSIKRLLQGGLLMDTPGMRELQLSDCEEGIEETFSEIKVLEKQCRFFDCAHISEPGCAVQAALQNGELESRRFNNYQKLMREHLFNSATLAEKRARDRAFSKKVNHIQNEARSRKKGH